MSDVVPPNSSFPATRWTLLQRLRSGAQPEARAALETLCRAYWHPLYGVARQNKLNEHDAQDAVQGFFLDVLRRETFAAADQTRGKLRQLLLTAFDNYCHQQWRREQRQIRAGSYEHIEFIDADSAEERYLMAKPANTSVEALYNRQWASALLERSLERLRADYARRGWQERYDTLVNALLQDEDDTLAQQAEKLGVNPGTLRVNLHRMKNHYRAQIEHELAATIDTDDPQLIREEMTELFSAFA